MKYLSPSTRSPRVLAAAAVCKGARHAYLKGRKELRNIADALSSRKRGLAGMSLGLDPAARR
jgi:hypothetical protein